MIRLTFIAAMLMADVAWAGLDLSLRPVGRAGTGARNVEALAERPLEAQLHLVAARINRYQFFVTPNATPKWSCHSGDGAKEQAPQRGRLWGPRYSR